MNRLLYALPFVILAMFVLERVFPLRAPKAASASRIAVNVCLGALGLLTALVVVKPIVIAARDTGTTHSFGLLNWIELPMLVEGILAFLLLDVSFYYWHRANHTVPILWRLHVVHHLDPDLDVTTAFRFHFGEVALSAGFRGLQVLLIGGPIWAAVAYEFAFQVNTGFQHSNLRLPIGIERALNALIVTPRMHGIHHSKLRHETNSNWSVIFSFWDRLHGSLRLDVPQSGIDIGIAGYSRPGDNRLWNTLVSPFRTQRDYWQGPVIERSVRAPGAAQAHQELHE